MSNASIALYNLLLAAQNGLQLVEFAKSHAFEAAYDVGRILRKIAADMRAGLLPGVDSWSALESAIGSRKTTICRYIKLSELVDSVPTFRAFDPGVGYHELSKTVNPLFSFLQSLPLDIQNVFRSPVKPSEWFCSLSKLVETFALRFRVDDLVNRRQKRGETVALFLAELSRMANGMDPPLASSEIIRYFVRGLRPEIRQMMPLATYDILAHVRVGLSLN
jgi:hypothetical protein